MEKTVINQLSIETRHNLNEAICSALSELIGSGDLPDLFRKNLKGMNEFWKIYAMSITQYLKDIKDETTEEQA